MDERFTVSVAPTSTLIVELDVRGCSRATLQVDNLDASQTFAGVIQRRVNTAGDWSPSTLGDYAEVGPLQSVTTDLDVDGTGYIRLVGSMSGAGGDVAYSVRVGSVRWAR